MRKDFWLLFLICTPGVFLRILVIMALHDWILDERWLTIYSNHLDLIENVTPFMLGIFLIINTGFFIKLLTRFKVIQDDIQTTRAILFLRVFGLTYLIASIISSHYAILKLAN